MGIVQLDGKLFVETLRGNLLAAHDAQHVLQGAGDKEELLGQTQLLALDAFVDATPISGPACV